MVVRLVFSFTRAPWDPAHQLLSAKYILTWKISFLCTELLSQNKKKLWIVLTKLGVIFYSSVTFHHLLKRIWEQV